MPNGTRAGGMVGMHDAYGGSAHGTAMVFHPFMVPPLMMQHQQQHASPWGAPGMMQQQVGGEAEAGVSIYEHAALAWLLLCKLPCSQRVLITLPLVLPP